MPQTVLKQGFAQLRKEIAIIGGALLVVILLVGWGNEVRSCLRASPVRDALIDQRELNRGAIPFWNARGELEIAKRLKKRVAAEEHIRPLSCWRPLPGV